MDFGGSFSSGMYERKDMILGICYYSLPGKFSEDILIVSEYWLNVETLFHIPKVLQKIFKISHRKKGMLFLLSFT
jgi:hypothetical protein